MSTPFRFRNLPAELRNRIYQYVGDRSRDTRIDALTELPSLAYVPDLRAEFLPVYVGQHTFDLDLVYNVVRVEAASHIRAYDHSIFRNATQFHILVNDDGNDFYDAVLRFALGEGSVNWSTPNAGSARRDNVHAVFDSLQGSIAQGRVHARQIAASSDKWRLNNKKAAKKMADAISNILVSHGPLRPPRITTREL
jgi:hypothetical protein